MGRLKGKKTLDGSECQRGKIKMADMEVSIQSPISKCTQTPVPVYTSKR